MSGEGDGAVSGMMWLSGLPKEDDHPRAHWLWESLVNIGGSDGRRHHPFHTTFFSPQEEKKEKVDSFNDI